MRADQLASFKTLNDEAVFADIFDQVRDDMATQWAKETTAEGREELWQRQRALRDVRRAFTAKGGLDV